MQCSATFFLFVFYKSLVIEHVQCWGSETLLGLGCLLKEEYTNGRVNGRFNDYLSRVGVLFHETVRQLAMAWCGGVGSTLKATFT